MCNDCKKSDKEAATILQVDPEHEKELFMPVALETRLVLIFIHSQTSFWR
jgi:hypothetical protein